MYMQKILSNVIKLTEIAHMEEKIDITIIWMGAIRQVLSDWVICISYNTGKSALPDIYTQCPRARSA